MMHRIRQLYRACFAVDLSPEERTFVALHLRPVECALFYAMDVIDQRHALAVSRTIASMAEENEVNDQALLVRLALLHDVGRRCGDMGIWGKVLAVLFDAICPQWSRDRARRDGTRIQHTLYVYYHHPVIGAELLRSIGCAKEAAIIERHHTSVGKDEPIELTCLRRADEAN